MFSSSTRPPPPVAGGRADSPSYPTISPPVAVGNTRAEGKRKKKPLSALVAVEEEGRVWFPSRSDSEFCYRLTLTKRDTIQVWIKDKTSKRQWESKELRVSEIVPADRAIPTMKLSEYFECFNSCLLEPTLGLCNGLNKHDLVPVANDNNHTDHSSDLVQLQLTIGVQIFSKVLSPTYSFTLHPVVSSEMSVLNTKIRGHDAEIGGVRVQVNTLASRLESVTNAAAVTAASVMDENPFASHGTNPQYVRAVTTATTGPNQPLLWERSNEGTGLFGRICNFQDSDLSGAIRFVRDGLYGVQIVVHHTNTYNPDGDDGSNKYNSAFEKVMAQQMAFVLQKDGLLIASSAGSTPTGTIQSSSLSHILPMKRGKELQVVYAGNGIAKEGCYLIITEIK